MTRRSTVEDQFSRLRTLADESDPELVRRELTKALRSRSALLVERAARFAAEHGTDAVADELVAALERLLERPAHMDKGCCAKNALARALLELGVHADEVLLRGTRHRQPEPAYGGPVDTAVELRGLCIHGLMRCHHPDALLVAVDLLADREWIVRQAAARALVGGGRVEVEPLLRLKALCGDPEPEVIGECLASLLRLAPHRSLHFVATFLDNGQRELEEVASLALGASRLEEAVALLVKAWRSARDPDLRRTHLLALATTRRELALEFLMGRVAKAPEMEAAEAVTALSVHRHDEAIRQQVVEAIKEREEDGVRLRFVREFGEA